MALVEANISEMAEDLVVDDTCNGKLKRTKAMITDNSGNGKQAPRGNREEPENNRDDVQMIRLGWEPAAPTTRCATLSVTRGSPQTRQACYMWNLDDFDTEIGQRQHQQQRQQQ